MSRLIHQPFGGRSINSRGRLIKFARAARRPSPDRWLFHGAVGVLLAVMFGGYFEVNLGDSEVLALFLSVVGAAYAARYTQEQGVSS